MYSLLIVIFIVLKPILANTLIIAEFAVAVLVALSRLELEFNKYRKEFI